MDDRDMAKALVRGETARNLFRVGRCVLRGLVQDRHPAENLQNCPNPLAIGSVGQNKNPSARRHERAEGRFEPVGPAALYRDAAVRPGPAGDGGNPFADAAGQGDEARIA